MMGIYQSKTNSMHQENIADLSAYIHNENTPVGLEWDGKQPADGDTAMALFPHKEVDPEGARKLLWKIDLMTLPYLATTLGYAAIFGIEDDIHLHGTQYSWLSSVFYFGFLAWAFPTNFLLQRLPIGKYLRAEMKLHVVCEALPKTYNITESIRGVFLGVPQKLVQTLLLRSSPVMGLDRSEEHFPREYEFIVIGCLCATWGIVMFIFLPDSPVTAPFLSQRERRIAVERVRENQTGIENKQHIKPHQIAEAFMDYKLYFFFFFFFLGLVCNIPNGGIPSFGTLIIKGFGFSTLVITLMQIPYGVIVALSILICVCLNDRFENWHCTCSS
ncbi:MFS general substrate transporter [Aspergillus heteromorphus CBS 117.55]|uniref:MFS general substrate transporter n=1 Tax=Aspergillus heteromorphus CBS 117.55 TaxID=1448321 RepID=A0A317WZT5_9EURO|nr:MFS general substrate transporter [Aspergillus heteromorphus CBS 117.55]PWY90797.1 MFS general substrate transporter [Aspergillus heteromorphus CBS 117.55]